MPQFRQKLRIRFAKRGDLRFISHHDLMRLWERACRRAALPLRMSEGFNPRPRLSFPLSLAVGIEGREEVAEVQLDDWLAPAEVQRRLQAALPADVALAEVAAVDPQRKAAVVGVTCVVEHEALGRLSQGDLEALLARREILAPRRRKATGRRGIHRDEQDTQDAAGEDRAGAVVDIRPYIRALALLPGGTEESTGMSRIDRLTDGLARPEPHPVHPVHPRLRPPGLRIELKVTPGGTARPDEVLKALGVLPGPEDPAPRITRERVRLADQ